MKPKTRYDILLQGRVLNRQAKREASDDEYNTLLEDWSKHVIAKRLRFIGNLAGGAVYHPKRNMGVRDLAWANSALRQVMGGSYYFDGRLSIADGNLTTLAEQKLLRQARESQD